MTKGMADIIAAHRSVWECTGGYEDDRAWLECSCRDSIKNDADNWTGDTEADHAAHVAEELAKAEYGNVQEANADQVRAHTITVTETTAAGFDFKGCSNRNPDDCACNTWAEVICQLCDESISDGQLIQTVTYPTIHCVDYDSMDQEWETDTWHTACVDPLAAALADPEGHALVKAIHDRKAGA